ncbi:unnamed protein product, partial [Brassica rapa subsp. narinosa]
ESCELGLKSCAGENFICLTTAAFFSFSFAQLESSKQFYLSSPSDYCLLQQSCRPYSLLVLFSYF